MILYDILCLPEASSVSVQSTPDEALMPYHPDRDESIKKMPQCTAEPIFPSLLLCRHQLRPHINFTAGYFADLIRHASSLSIWFGQPVATCQIGKPYDIEYILAVRTACFLTSLCLNMDVIGRLRFGKSPLKIRWFIVAWRLCTSTYKSNEQYMSSRYFTRTNSYSAKFS